jgi:hypothetical protein
MQWSGLGVLASALTFWQSCRTQQAAPALEHPLIFSRIADQAAVSEAGKAYLVQSPAENSRSQLASALLSGGGLDAYSDPSRVAAFLNQRIQEDFRRGEIVVLQGWILSRTEARQWAFFALRHN